MTGLSSRARVRLSAAEYAGGVPPIALHRSARLETARHPARTPPRTRIEETLLDIADLQRCFDDTFALLSSACGSPAGHAGPDPGGRRSPRQDALAR